MSKTLEKVPTETRWAIAAQGLTGAVTAAAKALRDALGQEKYDKVWGQIWAEQGGAAKQVADALGLAGDDLRSVVEAWQLVVNVGMGPEAKTEIVEATPERVVLRSNECVWWNRAQEMGITGDMCSVSDPAFCNAFAKSLNPKVTVSLSKARPSGDSSCEWVWELQK